MLPKPDRKRLQDSPIELAIIEIQLLGQETETIDAKDALKLASLAGGDSWPVSQVEPAERRNLQLRLTPGSDADVVVQDAAHGWSLSGRDATVTAQIFPQLVVVQVNGYESWEDSIEAVLAPLLRAVHEVVKPVGVQRIGLRYVNRLTDRAANSPHAWIGRISEALIAPLSDTTLGPLVVGAQQQLELAWNDGVIGIVRHGPFWDASLGNASSYLLDIDISEPSSTTFEPDRVLSVADGLHLLALSVFQACITPDYLGDLQGGL